MPRPYPALAIELQHYLSASGLAFDMNVACSSATFGIKTAADMLAAGTAGWRWWSIRRSSGHLNFRDRDSHFIFGDACTAVLLEQGGRLPGGQPLATGGQQAGDPVLKQHPQQLRLP